jgi:hypothetical protein
MRLGLLGPARGDEAALREALEFLVGDAEVDEALYLGEDAEVLSRVATALAWELAEGDPGSETFLRRAVDLSLSGTAEELSALLDQRRVTERLAGLRSLPPPPARAVEMIEDRIIIAVHDKAILDEEDILNAQLIVYGQSDAADLRRFGPRYFLTPGPCSARQVVVLEPESSGQVGIALFETSGLPVWRETMARRSTKVQVTR